MTVAAAWAVLSASRRRPGIDALLPAGLVLLAALLLGVHGPGSLVVVAGPPLALAAVYLLMVSHPPGEGGVWVPPGRTAAAISTGAMVLVVALAAGTHLPLATLRQPVNLRNSLSPPVDLGEHRQPARSAAGLAAGEQDGHVHGRRLTGPGWPLRPTGNWSAWTPTTGRAGAATPGPPKPAIA